MGHRGDGEMKVNTPFLNILLSWLDLALEIEIFSNSFLIAYFIGPACYVCIFF